MAERTDATMQQGLTGARVLVVEDEFMIAEDVANALTKAGATVVGPVGSVPSGLRLLAQASEIDAAILDVNLREVAVFPLAQALDDRGIPYVFATGYDQDTLPAEYRDAPRCEKPFTVAQVTTALAGVL